MPTSARVFMLSAAATLSIAACVRIATHGATPAVWIAGGVTVGALVLDYFIKPRVA